MQDSIVPTGLNYFRCVIPSTKVLGYYQASLTGLVEQLRDRPALAFPVGRELECLRGHPLPACLAEFGLPEGGNFGRS